MLPRLKDKAGRALVATAAFAFAALLLLNLTALFHNQDMGVGSSTALAAEKWSEPREFWGHWEEINHQMVCICGGAHQCLDCVARPADANK